MTEPRRLQVLIVLVLAVVLVIAAVVLWRFGRGDQGTSVTPAASPLPKPTAVGVSSFPSQFSFAVALLWVVLGGLLALGIAFLIIRRQRTR